MEQATKLTKRESSLLEKMKAGALLCCETDATEDGVRNGGHRWFLEPGGRPVGPKTAVRLVARGGLLRPTSAGLFGMEDAQTYEAAP